MESSKKSSEGLINPTVPVHNSKEDIWRHTSLRYLGYANEVGEAFRPILPKYVLPSYTVAFAYVGCDTVDKTYKTYKATNDKTLAMKKGLDVLIWQSLASVFIPGGVIRTITSTATMIIHSKSVRGLLNVHVVKWSPTAVGLLSIPYIIKPIDKVVDQMMDGTVRKWKWL